VGAQALEHSAAVTNHLRQCIIEAGGWLAFHRWMSEVLYAPGLGYYSAGSVKIASRNAPNQAGLTGDFVTAPELTPMFGRTVARQVAEVLAVCEQPKILEFGAGTGQLARDLLEALKRMGHQPTYEILELSADLKQRQQETLSAWSEQVRWTQTPNENFEGVILANEVLDAMPVHLVGFNGNSKVFERGVIWSEQGFAWQDRAAPSHVATALRHRMPALPNYLTEINLAGEAWVQTLGQCLKKGLVLLIDYGFTAHEYYHPQRAQGTLMCHIQHRAHDNPFFAPGLQDITAHVDFSAIAKAAHQSGLDVLGFTSQANFLLNAGLADQAADMTPSDRRAVEKLVSEAEMGELFKVLALGRHVEPPLMGFTRSDRRHHL
jgi:SAM-dependent MidA family methyltransferase